MSNRYEEEKERILAAVRAIMDHFPKYIEECNLNWPRCFRCNTEMCQVLKKDCNTYYQCMICMHKEFGI